MTQKTLLTAADLTNIIMILEYTINKRLFDTNTREHCSDLKTKMYRILHEVKIGVEE